MSQLGCPYFGIGEALGMPSNTYSIYTRAFAKVASGAKVTDADFGSFRFRRLFRPFDQAGQVAVALAVQDVNRDSVLKSKGEFEADMRRLLASAADH